ncbi:SGNH/GDSL hydrolase family protein [Oribacterium sp. WCC10]|uniref:SGNH/GDSL hydrolase family protein n=1 Tax=Oribacterium sp. WCC10 TaxID=1855343 RepID=UPI0008E2FC96|nr:SGNH/GDSL hydrolase family protein [Oribacterium sp. WCC10]SFG08692.1 Lysophospholipase L1 [Oribacterium sp. WCC10]
MKNRTITAALLITTLSVTPVLSSYADTQRLSESANEAFPTVPETESTGIYTPGLTQTDYALTGSGEETTAGTLTEEEILREQQNRAWLEEQKRLQEEALHAQKISEFFKDSVVIGDSVAQGFANYAANNSAFPVFQNLKFLTRVSYSVHNAFMNISGKSKHPIYQGQQMYAWDSLKLMGAKHIYTFFGLNDLWGGTDQTVAKYIQYITRIQQEIPDIKITIVSTTPIYKNAKEDFNNDTIRAFNAQMAALAAENGWGYIDIASRLYDSEGNLAKQYCSDKGIHQTNAAYRIWQTAFEEYAEAHLDDNQS